MRELMLFLYIAVPCLGIALNPPQGEPMLVQSIKPGERIGIYFADRLIGTIAPTRPGRTELAIDFPREYQIRREGEAMKMAAHSMPSMASPQTPPEASND
jgi:hypothetical protein